MSITFRYTTKELLDMTRRQIAREELEEALRSMDRPGLGRMWLVGMIDQLRQINTLISEAVEDMSDLELDDHPTMQASIRLSQLIIRTHKDLRQLELVEQYDETPSRESVYP